MAQHHRTTSAVGLTLTLCACGGGGTQFVYPSLPPPPPPVEDPGPPALPDAAIGLVGGPFTTYSASFNSSGDVTSAKDAVHISYSADDDIYTFSAPGVEEGHLIGTTIGSGSYSSSSKWDQIYYTTSFVSQGDSAVPQENAYVALDWGTAPYSASDLTYTSFGSWNGADGNSGSFVYGIPSTVGDIPVSGTADYSGQIRGTAADDGSVYGSIGLEFDFAAGTLSGTMEPYVSIYDGWDTASLGTYTFRDTVYSVGGTSFSGAFSVPGSDAPSSFQGNFNGPGAVELMGNFSAPYLSPNTGNWATMTGVFGGKKTP